VTDLSDPIAIFHAAVDALNADHWWAVVAVADPISLRVFRRQLTQAMSPAQVGRELPGIDSAEAAESLSPEEFFVHWLDGKSGRRRIEALIAARRLTEEQAQAVRATNPYH
jgi:hypothetical protein